MGYAEFGDLAPASKPLAPCNTHEILDFGIQLEIFNDNELIEYQQH